MYRKSQDWFDRASVIPGRSLTRSKAPGKFFPVGRGPLYAAYARGPYIYDADDNQFIDMLCALGAVSLGYGLTPHVGHGVYSLPHVSEVLAAERVIADVAPWAQSCRFVKTGSEAVHAAVMVARAATGQDTVLVADTSYHGWHSWYQARHGAPGVPGRYGQSIHTYRYGDITSITRIAAGLPGVAAVLVEPARWEDTPDGFLAALRRWCDKNGAMLIYDDMIYGLRFAKGGAAEYFKVAPDMACFGKALGNGAPIACVLGGAALNTFGEQISGTYSGDVDALQTVAEVLDFYQRHDVVCHMWLIGRVLQHGLREAVQATGWSDAAFVEGQPVHQRLRFVRPEQGKEFAARMAAHGVLWHPDVVNVSWSHTEQIIDRVIAAVQIALADMER